MATPVIDLLKVTARNIEINYIWHTGAGRHAAIAALIDRLNGDLGAVLASGGDVTASLRPFLVLRILGVVPLHQMTGPHAVTCLAKLAELSRPGMTIADRVRAVLITPDNQLLTIRRVRPGQEPYSVLPGGGVETGEHLNTALARELREEIAATATIHSLLLILQQDTDRQYFYNRWRRPVRSA